jgi:hypothetical protein
MTDWLKANASVLELGTFPNFTGIILPDIVMTELVRKCTASKPLCRMKSGNPTLMPLSESTRWITSMLGDSAYDHGLCRCSILVALRVVRT